MGQPKFPRKKYDTPNHPWQGDRIKEENEVRKKFGLKNKREIWKAQSRLRSIRGQARELISRTRNPDDTQAAQEAKLLLVRLHREGYVGQDATLGDVLGMDVERILNRRLQSQVYLKGMARTPNQARQFVSHGLVTIGERRVTVPSYVVRREEEDLLTFHPNASVADPSHPVRPRAPGQDVVEAAASTDAGARAPAEVEAAQAAPAVVEEPRTKAPAEEPKAETAEVEAAPAAPAVEESKPEATEEAKAPAKAEAAPAPVVEEPKPEAAKAAPEVVEEPKETPAEEVKPEATEEAEAPAKAEAASAPVVEEPKPEAAKAASEVVEEPKAEETKKVPAAETVEEPEAEETKETKPEATKEPAEEPAEASETTETETKEGDA